MGRAVYRNGTGLSKAVALRAALEAADQAIELDEEDGEAYYERACALARLGRLKEAMAALEKGVELYSAQVEWMDKEDD